MNRQRIFRLIKNIGLDAAGLGGVTRLGFDALEAILLRYGIPTYQSIRWTVVGVVGIITMVVSGRNTIQEFAVEDVRQVEEAKRLKRLDDAIDQQVTSEKFQKAEHKIITTIKTEAETIRRLSPNSQRLMQKATRSDPMPPRHLRRANSVPKKLGKLSTIVSIQVSSSSDEDNSDEKKRKSKSPEAASAAGSKTRTGVLHVPLDIGLRTHSLIAAALPTRPAPSSSDTDSNVPYVTLDIPTRSPR